MTDMELKREVESELNWDPEVKSPAAIAVSVKNGVVTIIGHVASYPEKLAVEQALIRVSGVKAFANELEIRSGSSDYLDEDIARAAADALKWTAQLPHEHLKIKVENGIITLIGTVDWYFQLLAAEDAVRSVIGVRSVINLIEILPAIDENVITARIEEALRNANLDAHRFVVESTGSKITLRGAVPSWRARREAERIAWESPGVTEVDNLLTVELVA